MLLFPIFYSLSPYTTTQATLVGHYSTAKVDYKLVCLIEGSSTSTAFEVEVPAERTVFHLKDAIKTQKASEFHDIDADRLTLWKVSLSTTPTRQITLSDLKDEEKSRMKLKAVENPLKEISKAFGKRPAQKKIHVIVQHPPLGNTTHCSMQALLHTLD